MKAVVVYTYFRGETYITTAFFICEEYIMNKKEHLKPAFILCGIVAAIIIILFIFSNNVNKNVVNNMTGRILYTETDGGVKQYSFDDDTDTLVSGDIENACFGNYVSDGIIFAGTDEYGVWNIYFSETGARTDIFYTLPDKAVLIALTGRGSCMAAAYSDGGKYYITAYDMEKDKEYETLETEDELLSLCFDEECEKIYYTSFNGNESILESVRISGGADEKLLEAGDERLTFIAFRNDTLYFCEDKDGKRTVSQYILQRNRATVLKFSSDEYNCRTICPVYDEKFIVSSDREGVYEIYVCNGSNMVKADRIGNGKDCFVTAYFNTEE